MIVSRAAAPKETMSCRTQGDFYSIKIVRLEFELCGWDLSLEAEIWP